MHGKRGQSILYTVLLLPTFLLVFALAVDLGTAEMQQLRLRSALDIAAVDAATAVDTRHYSESGRLRLDPVQAPAVARRYLYANLLGLARSVGGTDGAARIAATAQIQVVNQVPGRDPFTGMAIDRPAICIQIHVPYRTSVMRWWGGPGGIVLTVHSVAEIRS